MTDLNGIKESLKAAALEGGKILKESFRSGNVHAKTKSSWADLVTNIDLKTQDSVIARLSRDLPGVQVIGEEKENEAVSEEVIYLDPLDGTLNYFHGLPMFAISIGYWVAKKPVAGVVYIPMGEELYWGTSGHGAFRNGEPLRVSQNRSLSQSFLATGWPYDRGQISKALRPLERILPPVQEVRVLGSCAISMCYVASGVLEAYWEWGLYPWDVAAGVVIAQEAGARMTSPEGEPFKLESGAVLASNGYVHEEILKLLGAESG